MVLSDGLSIAIADQKRHGFWMLTERLEKQANDIKMKVHDSLVNAGNEDLTHAKQLLIEIEKWKAMCIGERMGAAESNSTELIWESLRGAIMARNDLDALQSVMHLRGFGRAEDLETGQRRAKVATSVLRFLFPEEWGVVDWRTAAVSSILDKCMGDVDVFMEAAKSFNAKELRDTFSIIDELGAIAINKKYRNLRCPEMPRTADVDMALFGLSLKAWPINNERSIVDARR